MQLWRFEHEGQVCSGDFLPEDQKWSAQAPYMVSKGYFIKTIIYVIYGMVGLVILSVILIAITLKHQKNQQLRKSLSFSVRNSAMSASKLGEQEAKEVETKKSKVV